MEGLVEGQEERHGVGRPRLVYVLTDEGMEHFPTRYMKLTTRLLSQMKETMPGPVVAKLFNQIAEDLASEYTEDMKNLSMEERLDSSRICWDAKALPWNGKERRAVSDPRNFVFVLSNWNCPS